ncbi:MAG TPA: type II toxin-antitoxin system VapC family toxin [Caulobacteraceae bacterium]|nr:type II toxin-antitoxin system VapC family toxin [Caulobacteraceae bacterium]
MIAVDSSAVVAIAQMEAEADAFLDMLSREEARMAGVNYVEAGIVLIGRGRMESAADYALWLSAHGITIVADESLHAPALAAYLSYGRGFHRARLNLADCFAYALASVLNAPLLYKGADFSLTDIRPAYRAV